MPHPHGLSQWHDCVSTHLPHLSVPQRTALALWSFGIVLAHSCGLTSVATLVAMLLHQSDQTVRERLREWRRPTERKRGASQGGKRRDLDVTTCFAPLLRWVIQLLPTDCRTLAVAMDASTLGQRFTILNISVVIRSSAIPIAWTIVAATAKGAWQPHWERLFGALRGVTPVDWTVITGNGYSARCAVSPPSIGRSSCSPIGAWMPAGCFTRSRPWGGIRSCASIDRGSSVPQMQRRIGPCCRSSPKVRRHGGAG